jgi:hypothetical protein
VRIGVGFRLLTLIFDEFDGFRLIRMHLFYAEGTGVVE